MAWRGPLASPLANRPRFRGGVLVSRTVHVHANEREHETRARRWRVRVCGFSIERIRPALPARRAVGAVGVMGSEDLHWQSHRARTDPFWESWLEASPAHLSLYPFWIEAIARARGRLEEIRVRMGTQGLLPYFARSAWMYGVPVTQLELAGNLHSYHQEIPVRGDPSALIHDLLTDSGGPWQVFHAAGVPRGGTCTRAVQAVARNLGARVIRYPGERSPYLPIKTDWNGYLAGRSRNFRYTLRRKRRALERLGVEECWVDTEGRVQELLACMWRIEEASWKVDAGMSMLADSYERVFYRHLLPIMARRGLLQGLVLRIKGEPAAYSLCYRWRGSVGQIKTSFDQRLARLAPGAVATETSIRRAFESGASEFDFLGPWMPHKALWTDHVRVHESLFVFAPDLRGRLLGLAKAMRARLVRETHVD
jgi:hypothetical protein